MPVSKSSISFANLGGVAHKVYRLLPIRLKCFVLSRMKRNLLAKYKNVCIHPSAQILGVANVAIGSNTVIGADCWLNVNHRTRDVRSIVIGNNCFIGRRNFFSSGRLIELGSFVLTANDCQFLGSSHIFDNPMVPCIISGTTSHDVISIGHNTFLGAGVRVLGSVSIGHGCVIGAGSLVTNDVPPFSQAFGTPARVYKRFSFAANKWLLLKDYSEEDDNSCPSPEEYLATLSLHSPLEMPYIAAGSDMGHL